MERSSFFNSVAGDRKYQASDFADYFSSLINNGVFLNSGTSLQVVGGSGMTSNISAGRAWINGYLYINDASLNLTHDVADGVLNRIDRIVVHFDAAGRSIHTIVKKGAFASVPAAPSLQRDADAYELGIADVYIPAGATAITQSNISDIRYQSDVCGIVTGTIDQIDADEFTSQFTDSFNTWFNGMKGQLTTDAAGNLQTEIDNIISGITKTAKAAYADTSGNVAQQMDIIDGNFQVSSIGAAYDTPYAYNNYGAGYPIWDTWKYNTIDTKCGIARKRGPSVPGSHDYAAFVWTQAISHQGTSPNGFAYQLFTWLENGVSKLCKYPKLTLSFWAKGDAAGRKLKLYVAQQYGDGGSPSAPDMIAAQTITLTTYWKRYSVTLITVDPSTRTFGTSNNDVLTLILQNDSDYNTSASGEIDFTQFQFDIGEAALPYRPKSLAQELQQTMRYYERSYSYGVPTAENGADGQSMGTALSQWLAATSVRFSVPKRIPPIMALYADTTATAAYDDSTGTLLTASYAGSISASGFGRLSVGGPGTTAGHSIGFHWVADARY